LPAEIAFGAEEVFMNVTLTVELEEIINQKIGSGQFNSASMEAADDLVNLGSVGKI
jgi:hypothetical protein